MTTERKVRPAFNRFIKMMWKKLMLPSNQEKESWLDMTMPQLIKRCEDEHYEFMRHLLQYQLSEAAFECADEANFRMMVVDMIYHATRVNSDIEFHMLMKEINGMQHLREKYGL